MAHPPADQLAVPPADELEDPPPTRPGRRLHRRRRAVPLGLLLLQATVVVLFLVGVASPLRSAAAVAYLLAVPGFAVVGTLRLDDRKTEWSLAVATSIALGTIVAQALVWSGAWSPGRCLAILAGLATPLLLNQLRAPEVSAHVG